MAERHKNHQLIAWLACSFRQTFDIHQPQPLSEHIVDTAARHIEVGVRRINGDVVLQAELAHTPDGRIGAQRFHTLENKRMVADDEIGLTTHSFLCHRQRRRQRQKHAPHLGVWIAELQSDVVPVFFELLRRQFFQRLHNVHYLHDRSSSHSLQSALSLS